MESTRNHSGYVVERDVMVTMRDGVRLATDVYRPARDGVAIDAPCPVIIERTPYDKSEPSRSELRAGETEPMCWSSRRRRLYPTWR